MNSLITTAILLFAAVFVGFARLVTDHNLQVIYDFLASLDDSLPQGSE